MTINVNEVLKLLDSGEIKQFLETIKKEQDEVDARLQQVRDISDQNSKSLRKANSALSEANQVSNDAAAANLKAERLMSEAQEKLRKGLELSEQAEKLRVELEEKKKKIDGEITQRNIELGKRETGVLEKERKIDEAEDVYLEFLEYAIKAANKVKQKLG